jgi:hypothetical protein
MNAEQLWRNATMTNLVITDPVTIIYRKDGKVTITTNPAPHDTTATIGMMICDAVRQIAAHFNNDEATIWQAMEHERQYPTDAPTPDGVV